MEWEEEAAEQEICAAIFVLQTSAANVWERPLSMHVKTKMMAFGGLLLALCVLCMALGSVFETGTLFFWQQDPILSEL